MNLKNVSLVSVLVESGILSETDAKSLRYVVEADHPGMTDGQLELLMEAYLVNKNKINDSHLDFARDCKAGLESADPLVRTKTLSKMARLRAMLLRKQITENTTLSDVILRSSLRLSRKSSSSEYLALRLAAKA